MSDSNKKVEAKEITGKATATPVPKLTKAIMPVPDLAKTAPQMPQGNQFDFSKVHVHFAVPCYDQLFAFYTVSAESRP
jgi:hypothetical protein